MQDLKFRYLINGKLYYYALIEIEGAMACSEVMSQRYTARDQWIRKKDKNGQDIYENDLKKFLHPIRVGGYPHGDDYLNKYVIRKVIFEKSEFHANHHYYDDTPDWDQMEIVGNMHLMPELEDADGERDLDFRKRC